MSIESDKIDAAAIVARAAEVAAASAAEAAKSAIASSQSASNRAAVIFIIGALATLGTGFLSIRAIAQDAGSGPVAVVADRLESTQAELARHIKEESESRASIGRRLERQDEKQDLVLDALRVPLWKRPEPIKDGGR